MQNSKEFNFIPFILITFIGCAVVPQFAHARKDKTFYRAVKERKINGIQITQPIPFGDNDDPQKYLIFDSELGRNTIKLAFMNGRIISAEEYKRKVQKWDRSGPPYCTLDIRDDLHKEILEGKLTEISEHTIPITTDLVSCSSEVKKPLEVNITTSAGITQEIAFVLISDANKCSPKESAIRIISCNHFYLKSQPSFNTVKRALTGTYIQFIKDPSLPEAEASPIH